MSDEYNSRYSNEEFYWGLKPDKLVVKSIPFIKKNSKILDLGSGEGKDSLFLAKKGNNLTAVDISEKGIEKTNKFAKENNLKIKTEISNIKDYLNKSKKFDAIYAINVLQFIPEDKIFEVVKKMQNKTKKNGINVIASFIAENTKQKDFILKKGRYFFNKRELKKLYDTWEIEFYLEKLGDWETHGEKPHRHFIVNIIARKKI